MPRVPTNKQVSARTEIDPADTRKEIKRLLTKYHATAFAFSHDDEFGFDALQFKLDKQTYRLTIRHPKLTDDEIALDKLGRWIPQNRRPARRDQIIRQRWRQLKFYVHAALDAKESGLLTLDEAFFAYLVIPDGRTMREWMQDSVAEIERTGAPPALPAPRQRREP